MNNNTNFFDFKALGLAIKSARKAKGITREQLAEVVELGPRHIQYIENEGQYPSFRAFVQLVKLFDVSVDQYIFSDERVQKTTRRRQLDSLIDTLSENELMILEGTVNGIRNSQESEK